MRLVASRALLYAWPAVVIAGPVAGLVLGPWLRRTLSRRVVLLSGAAPLLVVALAFTPVSLPGVLADHLVLAATYVWICVWLGMLRSRALRAAIFGVPALFAVWSVTRGFTFFLVIAVAELTALPERTISLDCGWSTRVVRDQPYGWVARSGHELSVHSRAWGVPLEVERGRRRFDDGEYPESDLFSARVIGGGDCTTVVAYAGRDEWRAP